MPIMKTLFFAQYGDEVEFQNKAALIEKLSNVDCSVPDRTQERKSSHRERHCLKTYLMQLGNFVGGVYSVRESNERIANRELKELVKKGIVIKKGSGVNFHYELAN